MLSQVESSWNPSPLPIVFLAYRNLRAVLGPHVLLWFARHVFFSPDAQAVLSSFECDPHSVWLSTKSCLRLKLQHSKIFQALAQGTVNPCEPPRVSEGQIPLVSSPGYLATWLGYYLCHHHWEMAWRFCLKVNPRLGKRSHGRPCPIGFTGESTGFLAPKRIPEKALEFGCRTYTRQFVYVCLNLEILLGDLGAYACDECAGASFWYGWHFAESHAQSSKSDDQRKHFPWPDPEFNHK